LGTAYHHQSLQSYGEVQILLPILQVCLVSHPTGTLDHQDSGL
jgi:hypothetical protein